MEFESIYSLFPYTPNLWTAQELQSFLRLQKTNPAIIAQFGLNLA